MGREHRRSGVIGQICAGHDLFDVFLFLEGLLDPQKVDPLRGRIEEDRGGFV